MKLKLTQKKQETPDVISFIFTPPHPVTWKAGQFFHYVLHHEPTDERGSDRWFTNSAAPFENQVRITIRITDKGSSFKKKLISLQEGEDIEISDQDGDFVINDTHQEYVFIAGGIGITPFRSILRQLDYEKAPINVTLLYASKDMQIVYQKELETIAANHPHFKIHYIFSPEHIDERKIRECVIDIQKPIFYISGPEPMVESLGNELKEMGIVQDRIRQDWFPGYPAE